MVHPLIRTERLSASTLWKVLLVRDMMSFRLLIALQFTTS